MSRDPVEAYQRAYDLSTDCGYAIGRLEAAIDDAFGLDPNVPFDYLARDTLIRHAGLVRCEILLDGHQAKTFDVPSRHQGPKGWPAWVMPLARWSGDEREIEDLIAFADDGRHGGKVWTLLNSCPAIGLDRDRVERSLTIFTQPKLWLRHWISWCRNSSDDARKQAAALYAAETTPEAVSALVIDPKRVRWRPAIVSDCATCGVRLECAIPAGVEELRFADSPQLRDEVAKLMRLEIPRLPVLRAAKAKPELPRASSPDLEPAKSAFAAAGNLAHR